MDADQIPSWPSTWSRYRVVSSRKLHNLLLRAHWEIITDLIKTCQNDWVAGPDHLKGLYGSAFSLGDYREGLDAGWGDPNELGEYYFVPESIIAGSAGGFVPLGTFDLVSTDQTFLGADSMVTLDRAGEIILAHIRKMMLRHLSNMAGRNTYRSFLLNERMGFLAMTAANRLYERVEGMVLPRKQPNVLKYMSVRGWSYGVGAGWHNWIRAYHFHPGADALSEAEYLRRHYSRMRARRKTRRRYRYLKRQHKRAPETKYPRPRNQTH